MNFLAHLYLSGDHPQVMVGNFIGDFVKGRDLAHQYPPDIVRGIEMHRAIDDYTDHHPIVRISKSRLWPKYRHYSGVITDIYFDHFLASQWDDYSSTSLADYATGAYQHLLEHEEILPERVLQMLPYMMKGNWLLNYREVEGIRRALSGMSRRASFVSNMEHAAGDLTESYAEFRQDFDQFFPALRDFCANWQQSDPHQPLA
ncbi:MAG TPA: ACP phosphodiesterase [Cyclobacteriaceae bacterium]|nr:ACP phosphodiesterase [Cyclobacteriaceae bacterium]